jgi:hypothetical protein
MLLGLITLASAGTLADCPQTWDAAGLADVVQSADLYLGKMDPEGFSAANQMLLTRLVCVNEPLTGPLIGSVHRIEATAASLARQDTRIAPALAGLLAADPGYQLAPSLYPEGHPIRELLPHASILARDDGTRALAELPSGWLEVDGRPMKTAPAARAAIIQQIGGDGQVVETRYVWPEDPLGAWAFVPGPAPAVASKARSSGPHGSAARVPLLIGTVASLAGTGVLYGLAASSATTFREDTGLDDDQLRALAGRANGLTVGYAAAGAAALGLGIGLVVSW